MVLSITVENFPKQLRLAGGLLRNNRPLPPGFGKRVGAFMRKQGPAIRKPMITALRENRTSGMGRLLAEVLVGSRLEPDSCVEIIEAGGNLLKKRGKRLPAEMRDFYLAAAKAFDDADAGFLAKCIELAKPAYRYKLDADLCWHQIKRHKMDVDRAVAFLAEMDNRRAYGRRDIAGLVAMVSLELHDPLVLSKYAAIRAWGIEETAIQMAYLTRSWVPMNPLLVAARILETRGWLSTRETSRFVYYLVRGEKKLQESKYLAHFCLTFKWDTPRKARLIKHFVELAKYNDRQIAVLANRVASSTSNKRDDHGRFDSAEIAELIQAVAVELNYGDKKTLELAKCVARLRGLKAERAEQFIALVTSSSQLP